MEINDIYTIIGAAALASTFVQFEPIKPLINKLTTFDGKFYHLLYKLLSCSKCVGLWLGLALTQNIFDAAIISCLASYITYQTNRL